MSRHHANRPRQPRPAELRHRDRQRQSARASRSSVDAEQDDAHAVIITDANVDELYAEPVADALAEQGCEVDLLIVDAGEQSKSIDVAAELWEQMLDEGADRKSTVVAVGGGVVGDLAGFVAATFARGLRVRAGADDAARAGRQLGRRQGGHQSAGRQEHGRRVLAAARRADRRRRARSRCPSASTAPAWPRW